MFTERGYSQRRHRLDVVGAEHELDFGEILLVLL